MMKLFINIADIVFLLFFNCTNHLQPLHTPDASLKLLHTLRMDLGPSLDHSLWKEHFRLLMQEYILLQVLFFKFDF